MAANPPNPPSDDEALEATPDDEALEDDSTQVEGRSDIKDAMTEEEIRAAGLAIDLPYEAPPGRPAPLQYSDVDKGWTPPPGYTIAGVPFDQVVAGIGGGAMPQQQQSPEAQGVQPPEAPESG